MLHAKLQIFHFRFSHFIKVIWLSLLLTSGCIRLERISTDTPTPVPPTFIQSTQVPAATSTPDYGWEDVSYLVDSICFEAALNIAGQVFKITDTYTLEALYTRIDRSKICDDAVKHINFEFSNGETIVGLWSAGTGCNARHDVQSVYRDDTQQQETIQLRFITEGDCPYELLQPFWIALPRTTGFTIQLEVEK